MKIFDAAEAKRTLLQRKSLRRLAFSPTAIERTERIFGKGVTPSKAVDMILDAVENDGDQALNKWSAILDGFENEQIQVPASRLNEAWDQLDPDLQDAMTLAKNRISTFHQLQPVKSWINTELGGQLGQRITAIESVGIYVPGGTAPLPSSLLMSVIPAQVAGVQKIIIATPPNPAPSILAAAFLCGVTEIYQIGGAQAIAALAFGTETVPKVNKIVGAGNLFVTLAKQKLYGYVGLDGLAGPTETMVIADETANPSWVAADLLAQAEHDVQASAILLTTSQSLAESVVMEIDQKIDNLSRNEIVKASLDGSGGIVLVDSLDQAAELANAYAAEHLCLSVEDPQGLMAKINNAGGFFLGDHSFEVLGDYIAGPSHIMPTSGTARYASPLNVLDFVKISSVIGLSPKNAIQLSEKAAMLAELEGLTAHAAAAWARLEGK
jgi:histidinol dehydrogenase